MTAQDLKNSILQLAVQGKLVPQDLNEMPVDLTKCKLSNVEELLFDIPDTWKIADIEAISKTIPSKQYQIKESEVRKEGTYIVISQSKDYSIGFSNDATKLYKHSKPVIVFGDHTTEVKHIDFDFVVGADGVKIFEPNEEIVISKYFYFVLLFYSLGIKNIGGYSRHYKYIKTKPFPVPPLAEQERIVAKIEELLPYIEEYDKAEKRLSALNAEFPDKLRKSILQQAVMGKLTERDPADEPASELLKRIRAEKEKLIKEGKIKKEKPLPPISEDEIPFEIPDAWEWVRLGSITSVRGGKRMPKGTELVTTPTDHIYVRVTDMQNGTILTNDLHYVPDDIYPKIKDYIINKEDVYLVIVGSTIGKTGLVPDMFDGMNLTENAVRLITVLIDRTYLYTILSTDFVLSQMMSRVKQEGQPKLAIERLRTALIPLPPLAEQKRIVARVEELLKICDELK